MNKLNLSLIIHTFDRDLTEIPLMRFFGIICTSCECRGSVCIDGVCDNCTDGTS